MYARICPECGCYLDPGEKCDCEEEREKEQEQIKKRRNDVQKLLTIEKNGQYRIAV